MILIDVCAIYAYGIDIFFGGFVKLIRDTDVKVFYSRKSVVNIVHFDHPTIEINFIPRRIKLQRSGRSHSIFLE